MPRTAIVHQVVAQSIHLVVEAIHDLMLIKAAVTVHLVNNEHTTVPVVEISIVIDKHIQMVTILAKVSLAG